MKILWSLAVIMAVSASGQNYLERVGANFSRSRPEPAPETAKPAGLSNAWGVWRVFEGVTNHVQRDPGWYTLSGRVIQAKLKGVEGTALVSGSASFYGSGWSDIAYMVKNLEYSLIDDDQIPAMVWGKYVGDVEYTTVLGAKKTVRLFDCGRVVIGPPPPPPFVLVKSKEAQERDRQIEANRVAWLRSEATNGVASAQYDLGMRYLSGKGVEKNEAVAREWLEKAAAKGHTYAKRALGGLPK